MPSFKSKVFNFLIVNRHLFRGKLKQEPFDFNTSIEGFRDLCEKGATRYAKMPEGIKVIPEKIGEINSEWVIPEGADAGKLIFYVHGGGYVSGSCNDHRGFVAKLAKQTGIANLQYEYRLAPEHPFPAAVDDSVMVYSTVLERGYKPANIVFIGDSAGGGLCLALLLALKEKGIPLPAAAVAVSPWTDLTCSGESYRTKNKVSAAPLNSWNVFSRYYAGTANPENPLISPLFGNLTGLPPILVNSGVNDELFDDGRLFCLKAKVAGVDVTFRAGEGMIHCYPFLAPFFPEATEAMDEICRFITGHLIKDKT
jgi:epsilon-lactone hydrolase